MPDPWRYRTVYGEVLDEDELELAVEKVSPPRPMVPHQEPSEPKVHRGGWLNPTDPKALEHQEALRDEYYAYKEIAFGLTLYQHFMHNAQGFTLTGIDSLERDGRRYHPNSLAGKTFKRMAPQTALSMEMAAYEFGEVLKSRIYRVIRRHED